MLTFVSVRNKENKQKDLSQNLKILHQLEQS